MTDDELERLGAWRSGCVGAALTPLLAIGLACWLLGGAARGAVAYESISAESTTTSTSLSTNAPSGAQVGDTLILCVAAEAPRQAQTPTGWTLISYRANSNNLISITTFWRVADGTGDDTPTVTFGTAPTVLAKATIVRLSGADPTSPLDAYVDAADPGFGPTVTIGTTTVTTNGSLQVGVAGNIGQSSTWSAGWTERFDEADTTGLTVATAPIDAGTSLGGTVTQPSGGRWVQTTIIIKPAAGGGPSPGLLHLFMRLADSRLRDQQRHFHTFGVYGILP